MTNGPAEAAYVCVRAFVDELARAGVRHVCIAPGSRSTPLVLAVADHPLLRTWVHLDERAAAFFALGMARVLGSPVALLCTSGTAAANFLPAVVEAHAAGIPLLVLTADRPPELRDVGAPQTIDQRHLFGSHAKWFVDVPLPEATPALVRYARTLAARATALAAAVPPGPVHLNFPFREPLIPVPCEPPAGLSEADALAWHGRPHGTAWVRVADGVPSPSPETVRRLAERLREARRPLLVCGPQLDASLPAPLAGLARALGAPLLADPLSQVRWGVHDRSAVIDRYDAALRHGPTAAALAPDLILRVGAPPTSKPLQQFLELHATAWHVVVDAARWPDPALLAGELVHADPARLCELLLDALRDGDGAPAAEWLARWLRTDAAAGAALSDHGAAAAGSFEGRALAEVAVLMPAGGTLVVSSSMPVRDLDAFAPGDARPLRVVANRGANGIDGVVSTALGAAAALREQGAGPLVLVIGDVAFQHDMSGLLAARLHALDATIVLINNDGGGIFSFLPQAADPLHFERLFGTPHGLDFAPAAALYGARYRCTDGWESLREGVTRGLTEGGLHIVEIRTDRADNVVLHRGAWAAVAEALDGIAAEPVP